MVPIPSELFVLGYGELFSSRHPLKISNPISSVNLGNEGGAGLLSSSRNLQRELQSVSLGK